MAAAEQDFQPYQALLQLNEGAFERGHYETAYHALMAALHAAEDESGAAQLEEVGTRAATQQEQLDALVPGHRLATSQAVGLLGVFSLAARQARTRAGLIRRSQG